MYKTLITNDRLKELARLINLTPKGGYCIEAGVYMGGSLKYMADHYPSRQFVGFDTFEGLPKQDWNDKEIHNVGDFNDTSFEAVSEYLKDNKNIQLIKGYFPDTGYFFESTIDVDLLDDPNHYYSFVHVDFDFKEGIKNTIKFFYPRLIKGGVMVFDDYEWPNCPGVKQALDESGLKYQPTNAKHQAYLIKN